MTVDRIAGRTAVVTGAGNGLGRAISIVLAERGARVVLCGRRAETLAVVAGEIGPRARVEVCDTSDAAAVDDLGHVSLLA